ncbi:MAG TPA: amidohydrolase family protein [Chitinophagaceae bacterium]|nr:amidohydrolase family protein [Chitinophagaceae bacterium]
MRFFLLTTALFLFHQLPAQLLIKNTNVIDVEQKKILAGYSVLIVDGKIVQVDKDKNVKPIPEGTTIIDGTGKYLSPGFTDAHIHFFQSGGLYARPDAIDLRKYRPYAEEIKWTHGHMEDLLRRYLSAGITSVIDVGATNNFLTQKDSFASKPWSPLVRMTGALLTTYVPAPYKNLGDDSPFTEMLTEENTRKAVRDQLPLNTDFIKIWYIVTDQDVEKGARKNLPLVQAAIDEAHKNNKRVAVHATERITAQLAVEAGADFLVHSVDDEIISDAFVQLLKLKKTVLCPTLVVMGHYGKVLGDHYHFSTDELNLANPETIGSVLDYPWPDTSLAKIYIKSMESPLQATKEKTADSIMTVNLQKLVNGGVTIATGTDAGNTGTQHASSYFIELNAMQNAGMNNWQLLEASTINGAKAMGQEKEWGSIAKNKMANLVLLWANPLDSIANWRKINQVIVKGVAHLPETLVNPSPEYLVQQQLNAYNAHDLDAFLEPYAEDVELYEFPGKLLMKGKDEMRKDYEFLTKVPKLYCKVQKRIIQGNMVIDHEEVSGFGPKPLYAVAIYIVEFGKISKVYFKQ